MRFSGENCHSLFAGAQEFVLTCRENGTASLFTGTICCANGCYHNMGCNQDDGLLFGCSTNETIASKCTELNETLFLVKIASPVNVTTNCSLSPLDSGCKVSGHPLVEPCSSPIGTASSSSLGTLQTPTSSLPTSGTSILAHPLILFVIAGGVLFALILLCMGLVVGLVILRRHVRVKSSKWPKLVPKD